MAEMTREDVLEAVDYARARGSVPDLSGLDLSRIDLSHANLHGCSLRDANLRGTKLLRANLSFSDLSHANLWRASLLYASLSGSNLQFTNFGCAKLNGANLSGARLYYANLSDAHWGGLALDGLYRYRCLLIPTIDGWRVRIGCWYGTVDELQALIDSDNWPESKGEQITRNRPRLQMWIDMCQAHIEVRPHVIPELARLHGGAA